MSGHLVTILCTLVSGFVFDFPTAGAQEVNLKCIGFLFSMMSEKIAAAESFPALFPPGNFAVKHIFSSLGPLAVNTFQLGPRRGAGAAPSNIQQQRPRENLGTVWYQAVCLWELLCMAFVFPSKLTVPRITCWEELWGLGVSAINPLQK